MDAGVSGDRSANLAHVTWCLGLVSVTAVVVASTGGVSGQVVLPDVSVALVVEVRDPASWLRLHDEILRTPREAPRALTVSLPVATGESRSLALDRPKFGVELRLRRNEPVVRLTVTGTIDGIEALRDLTAFEAAVFDAHLRPAQNAVTLIYGLSGITGHLVEIRLSRP